MQEDNKKATNFLDLLVGISEGGVKAVNFQPEENETLGFFGTRGEIKPLNATEYEITRYSTGVLDIRVRKDK